MSAVSEVGARWRTSVCVGVVRRAPSMSPGEPAGGRAVPGERLGFEQHSAVHGRASTVAARSRRARCGALWQVGEQRRGYSALP